MLFLPGDSELQAVYVYLSLRQWESVLFCTALSLKQCEGSINTIINSLLYTVFLFSCWIPCPSNQLSSTSKTKKVSIDEVCQLLLLILVSETYVTEADVSEFSPPGFFLMCFMPIFFFTLQEKKKIKSPNGAAFSKLVLLSQIFYRVFYILCISLSLVTSNWMQILFFPRNNPGSWC